MFLSQWRWELSPPQWRDCPVSRTLEGECACLCAWVCRMSEREKTEKTESERVDASWLWFSSASSAHWTKLKGGNVALLMDVTKIRRLFSFSLCCQWITPEDVDVLTACSLTPWYHERSHGKVAPLLVTSPATWLGLKPNRRLSCDRLSQFGLQWSFPFFDCSHPVAASKMKF